MKKIRPTANLVIILLFACNHLTAQTLMTGMPSVAGSIYAFEKVGSTIYIGGFFTEMDGIPRTRLGSFDAVTGTVSNWSPDVNVNGVTSLTRVANKLIAGGSFTEVNGQTRLGIAMFDLTTGNLDPWFDTANFVSWRMGVGAYNNFFYYSSIIDPLQNCRIVCVDATTGNTSPWQSDSTINGSVNAIYANGTHVYVGGMFIIGNNSTVYDDLCRFDQATGALDLTWHPEPAVTNFGVTAIVETDGQMFVGGDFNTISGVSREGIAGYNSIGTLSSFNQNSSSYEVLSLFPDGPYLWVGGNSYMLGNASRYRIAQIRISNSLATCWDASATSNSWSTTQAILVSGDTVYTGPFGNPELSVFSGTPLPQPGNTLNGPVTFAPFQTATYSVQNVPGHTYTWLVTGGTGTSNTNSINVTWGPGPLGTVSVIENNPSGLNCYSDTITLPVSITTAIDNLDDALLTWNVFPNPSNSEFIITTKNFPPGSLMKIYEVTGRLIFDEIIYESLSRVDATGWPSGIYFLKAETQDGTFYKKIIKE